MSTYGLMMLLICGVVWGGFAALLWRAVRREADKERDASTSGRG